MNKKLKFFAIFLSIMAVCVIIFSGCGDNRINKEELIRIHVRANSNSYTDQEIKMEVKDGIVDYLSQRLEKVTSFGQAIAFIDSNLSQLKVIADKILSKNGYNYTAKVSLVNEYFPTRSYENMVVESGFYEAVIVELGSGKGDNWWCVVYPPLCFIGREDYGSDFAYKSKLKELWDKYFS